MMEFNGYDSAKYSVVTEDGYILEIHRNMGLKNRTWLEKLKRRPVVFMMHGLSSSSAEWLLMGKEKSLGK
jgi:lysosomal acid lipase/cholesteryl ester hydrolase